MKENYYLDNAATTWPKPEPVYQFMDSFFRSHGVNPGRAGHQLAVEAEHMIVQTRRMMADFFGLPGDPNRVVKLEMAAAERAKKRPLPSDKPGWIRLRDREPMSDLQPHQLSFAGDSEEEFFEALASANTDKEILALFNLTAGEEEDPFRTSTPKDFADLKEDEDAEDAKAKFDEALKLFESAEDDQTRDRFPSF